MSSPEQVVFREFSTSIENASVLSVSPFASKLYSKDIIDPTVRDNATAMTGHGPGQKALDLVKAIGAKLTAVSDKEREKYFALTLQVMDEIIPLDSVAGQMRKRYSEEVAKAKLVKENEKRTKDVNDNPGAPDSSDPGQVDRPAMMRALMAVENKLDKNQHSRYHLAVTVLMDGDIVATQGKGFLELYQTVEKKLGSCQLAVSFTIDVLGRSGWGDMKKLKLFSSPGYVLSPLVDLCLTVDEFYRNMDDKDFRSAKIVVSGAYLDFHDVSELDRSDFVLLLYREEVIVPGNVSNIEGDSKFFKGYKERCKIVIERSDNNNKPPTAAGAGINPPPTVSGTTTNTASSSVPKRSHVNGGGTNGTAAPLKRRVAADGPIKTDLPDVGNVEEIAVDYDDKIVYKMNTLPRGFCLIINMKEGREKGNEADVDSLCNLFERTLQFTVRVYDDLTENEIDELMEKVKAADHKWSCCFVMFILAHGGTDKDGRAYFVTSDARYYKVPIIKKQIESIPDLNGKPKLLFLQSCRGNTNDTGLEVLDDGPIETSKIPRGSDFLISFATIEDYAACRGADGSRFIQKLCEVFDKYHPECDVLTMITIVTKRVADIARDVELSNGSVIKKVKQNPETTFTLRKFLYFGKPPAWAKGMQ